MKLKIFQSKVVMVLLVVEKISDRQYDLRMSSRNKMYEVTSKLKT